MTARLTALERVHRATSEQQLQDKLLQLAELRGWWWHHTRPAWTPKGFRTPLGGMRGFPDFVLARTMYNGDMGQLLIVELKTELGVLEPEQKEWQRRLEPTGLYRLWRPSSWPQIERELM